MVNSLGALMRALLASLFWGLGAILRHSTTFFSFCRVVHGQSENGLIYYSTGVITGSYK